MLRSTGLRVSCALVLSAGFRVSPDNFLTRREGGHPCTQWFHWTMGYEMSEPHIPLKATHEHLRHAFLMAQKLLRTGDEEAARQMLTPRLQEAFAHVHASYTANGLSFWYDDESAHLDEGDVHLNRAFPRDFMVRWLPRARERSVRITVSVSRGLTRACLAARQAGTLNMLRKEHHAAFLAVLDDEDAKVADGLQESGEVRADSQLWPFLEMVGVTPSMLKNDGVQSGCRWVPLCTALEPSLSRRQ